MSESSHLTEEQIERELKELALWIRSGNYITREFVAANFAGAVGIINAVAVLSEAAEHHPDILLYGWNKVRVKLSTHHRGALTEKDISLAKKIESLNF